MKIAHPRLLITDDDRDFRETLGELLARRGFDTLLAPDGERALEIVVRSEVHLVLMDLQLPRLTGVETIRQMHQQVVSPPWILLSASITETVIAEAEEANVFSILSKPVRFDEVTARVNEALGQFYGWTPSN